MTTNHLDELRDVIRKLHGGDKGCGLYFCGKHLGYEVDEKDDGNWKLTGPQRCERCLCDEEPFDPKPDHKNWLHFKMHDWSWAEWRKENGLPDPKRMRKPKSDMERYGFDIIPLTNPAP